MNNITNEAPLLAGFGLPFIYPRFLFITLYYITPPKPLLLFLFFISSIWCKAQDNGTFWTSVGVSQDGFGDTKYANPYTGKALHGGFLAELGYSHKVWKYIGLAGLLRSQFYFYKDLQGYDFGGKTDYQGPFRHHMLLVGISGYIPITPESAIELRILTGPFWRVTPKVVVTEYNNYGYTYSAEIGRAHV